MTPGSTEPRRGASGRPNFIRSGRIGLVLLALGAFLSVSESSQGAPTQQGVPVKLSQDPCRFPGQWASWDPIRLTKRSIDPRWINAIRNDPSLFRRLAGEHGAKPTQCIRAVRAYLRDSGGSRWNGLNEEGARLVLATALAYEAVPYGENASSPRTLGQLLHASGLTCAEYVALTLEAYHSTLVNATAGSPPSVQFLVVGWRNDPTVPNRLGNHAELLTYGTGIALWLDPTAGIVAPFDLGSALSSERAPQRAAVSLSPRAVPENIRALRESLSRILGGGPSAGPGFANGRYLMYLTQPKLVQGHPPSIADLSNSNGDWVESVATDGIVHYYLTSANSGFRVDETGVTPLPDRYRSISSDPPLGSMFGLNDRGEVLRFDRGGELPRAVAHGAVEVETVRDGPVYVLLDDGSLLRSADGESFAPVEHGIKHIALGRSSQALYALTRDGNLLSWIGNASDVIATDIAGITGLRGGEFLAYWSRAGALSVKTRGDHDQPSVLTNVAVVMRAPGQWTLDVLLDSGAVCRVDLDSMTGLIISPAGVNLDDRFPYCGTPTPLSPLHFTRINLIVNGALLEATSDDGTRVTGQAASY